MADKRLVAIDGYTELIRAFEVAGSEMTKDLREGMRSAAQPVASTAESLGRSEISGLRFGGELDWAEMRIGVTRRSVYVAPKRRRTVGTPRRNFAALLLGRSMEPALEQNIEKVVAEAEDAIRDMSRAWERVG